MEIVKVLKRHAKRNLLVLSAGTLQSGVQTVFLQSNRNSWFIIVQAFFPYPSRIAQIIKTMLGDSEINTMACQELQTRISNAYADAAKATIAQAPRGTHAHLAVLNRLMLSLRSETIASGNPGMQNVGIFGSPQHLSSELGIAVAADLFEPATTVGAAPRLMTDAGLMRIARSMNGTGNFALVNIGVMAHAYIADTQLPRITVDAEICPGTFLINSAAAQCDCPDGFDRDGSFAARGRVDHDCLHELCIAMHTYASSSGSSGLSAFAGIMQADCVQRLSSVDRLATITALTARGIFDYFKRNRVKLPPLHELWISGGGANNLALREYLSAYFDPVPVKCIETIGIPSEAFVPLALGLSIDAFISGQAVNYFLPKYAKAAAFGQWVMPQ